MAVSESISSGKTFFKLEVKKSLICAISQIDKLRILIFDAGRRERILRTVLASKRQFASLQVSESSSNWPSFWKLLATVHLTVDDGKEFLLRFKC